MNASLGSLRQIRIVVDDNENDSEMLATWPLFLGLGLLVAHPFYLLANRVMYAGFENSLIAGVKPSANKNFFRAAGSVYRENGLRGFFRGFVPYSIFMVGMYHASFYEFLTERRLCDIRREIYEAKLRRGMIKESDERWPGGSPMFPR